MMGLRNLTILCSAIQVLGYACMGGVPIFWVNETPMAVYIGNGLVGFTAGVLLIPVGHVASTWMPDSERSTTLALCINAGNIGTGSGFFMSSLVASQNSSLRTYLNRLSLLPFLLLVSVVLFMQEEPSSSPSLADYTQRKLRKGEPESLLRKLTEPWRVWWRDLSQEEGVGGENGFLISILAYTTAMISIYTTATYLPEIFTALTVSESLQPILGASFFYLNVVGATFLTEALYSCFSQHVAVIGLLLLQILLHSGLALVLLTGYQSDFLVLWIACLAIISALCQAVACDFGCDVTFPADGNSVVLWQNVVGTIGITVFNVVFKNTAEWSEIPFAYSFFCMAAFATFSFVVALFWRGSYRRHEASVAQAQLQKLDSNVAEHSQPEGYGTY